MKNAIIFHGTGSSPNSHWTPWLKKELEANGFSVQTLQFPNTDNPSIEEWLPFALKNFKFEKNTILIGHSAGSPLILSILENIDIQIKGAILVAGFSSPIKGGKASPILQEKYNWDKIKSNARKFTFINSDNDPWDANEKQGMEMNKHLGGKLIILHEGHMGSNMFNQPYKEFPLLLKLILEEYQ
jgi:predicted alpha/beta hydrolase family esterase